MADDPYTVLGVTRDADAKTISSAYRKLAKQHHPDLNPGNKAAEDRFKAVAAAYDLLSDPEKRARFDRGEIDASGQDRPEQHFYRQHADSAEGAKYGGWTGGATEEELGDIFADLFRRSGQGGAEIRLRGADRHYTLTVAFLDAVNGATKRLALPGGAGLDVRIPPGLADGQVLRLRGKGEPGLNGGPDGDALIAIAVAPHAFFHRDGNDIALDLPVTLAEAVLGARVSVPTPGGPVTMTIPKHSDSGTKLRLRGRGVSSHGDHAAGDLYITLRVTIGIPDAALEDFLRDRAAQQPADPRAAMMQNAGAGDA